MNDSQQLVFGTSDPAIPYTFRPAAYGVICSDSGLIAVVKSVRGKYFLPGGGALSGETADETFRREVREELGYEVHLKRTVGTVIQYFVAEDGAYRMVATIFTGTLVGEWSGEAEHELCWMRPDEAKRVLYHQAHIWGVEQVFRAE